MSQPEGGDVPAWKQTSKWERGFTCITFLSIYGVLTKAERAKVFRRLDKKLAKPQSKRKQ